MYKEFIRQFLHKPPKERAAFCGIVVTMLTVLGLFVYSAVDVHAPLDREGCPGQGALENKIIVIDRTGVIPTSAKRAIRATIGSLLKKSQPATRFILFEIDSRYMHGLSSVIFSRCKGRDGSQADPLTENGELLRRRYTKDFYQPFMAAVEGCLTGSDQPRSPIMEALLDMTNIKEFQTSAPVTIYIFSDMLQNTSSYSHYRKVQNFQKAVKLPQVKRLIPNLLGANIEIYYLLRNGKEIELQSNTHAQFWIDYLDATNAQLKLIKKIR